ncbi:MAG: zinc ribbon domain-containing protein [Clostridia bacterium]|nr:zinc ribbon domain-containing protein [Clostridia bacterium]
MDLKFLKREIPKKVTKTYKIASEKSGNLIEEAKLRLQIASTNDKITDKLGEIGSLVYEDYKAGSGSYGDFEELCKEIETSEAEISKMKAKILKMKNMKQCEVCENPLALDDRYCSKCGAEQPLMVEEEEIVEEKKEPALTNCPNCDAKLSKDAVYCAKCGVKVNE